MSPLADFFLLSKEQILQKAEKLRGEGKHGKAAELLESGLKNNAEDFELLLALASAQQADKKGREAATALKNAVSLVPSRSKEVMEAAESLFFSGDRAPELGDLAFEMNVSRRNMDQAANILKPLPDRYIESMISRYQKVRDSLERYQGPAKPTGAKAKDMAVYFNLALLYERLGQPLPAFEMLETVAGQLPEDSPAVEAAAQRVASSKPGVPEFILRHGDVLTRLGLVDKALELYGEAAKAVNPDVIVERLSALLEKWPTSVPAMMLMVQLYLKKQDAAGAFEFIKKLWTSDKRYRDTLLAQLREVIKLDPRNPEMQMFMGDAALEAEKLDLAMAGFAKVAELAPERLEEVLARYQRILELSPGNFEAATRIIDAYSSAGRTEMVVKSLRDIVSKDPALVDLALEKMNSLLEKNLDQPQALLFLAECYLMRKENLKAAKIYRYLSRLGPEHLEQAISQLQQLVAKAFELYPSVLLLETLLQAERIQEAFLLGAELAKRHAQGWPQYLPLLDQAASRAGAEQNLSLASVCRSLASQNLQDHSLTLAEACALARGGRIEEASTLFLKLPSRSPHSEMAKQFLEELAGDENYSGLINLTLAELYQRDDDAPKMAKSLLAAAGRDKTLIPKVSTKLQELLKTEPDNIELLLLQLDLLFQQGLLEKAFALANAIVIKWPEGPSAKAYLRLGQIYLEKGELTKSAGSLMKASELDQTLSAESRQVLQRLMEIDSSSLPGRYALAKVLMHQNQGSEAVAELLQVAQREPKMAENVLTDLKAIQSADPSNHQALLAEARICLTLQRVDQAAAALSQALEISPELADQVIALYQKMLAQQPGLTKVKLALARALLLKNSLETVVELTSQAWEADRDLAEPAIRLLREVQSREQNNLPALYLLSRIYRGRSAHQQSIGLLKQALQISEDQAEQVALELQSLIAEKPEMTEARYLLAELCIRGERFDLALAEYEAIAKSNPEERPKISSLLAELLEKHPNQIEALLLKSRLDADSGDIRSAVGGLVRISELDPNRRAAAAQAIEKMMARDPNMPELYEALGTIYFEQGKFPQARDMLVSASKMLEDKERRMRVLFYLAESYLAMRQEDKAEEAMDQVRQLMPDADEVYRAMRRFNMRRMQVEVDKAYQALQEAPDDDFRKLDLANKLISVGKFDTALSLLAFRPQDKETANRRVMTLARAFMGRGEAISALEVLRNVPLNDHPLSRFQLDVCYLMGQCYEMSGNYPAAVSAYKMIYRDQTDFRDVRRRLDNASRLAVLRELGHRSAVIEAVA